MFSTEFKKKKMKIVFLKLWLNRICPSVCQLVVERIKNTVVASTSKSNILELGHESLHIFVYIIGFAVLL